MHSVRKCVCAPDTTLRPRSAVAHRHTLSLPLTPHVRLPCRRHASPASRGSIEVIQNRESMPDGVPDRTGLRCGRAPAADPPRPPLT